MRFLVDACVDIAVNRWLQERGDDSIHLRDQQLQRLPDDLLCQRFDVQRNIRQFRHDSIVRWRDSCKFKTAGVMLTSEDI